MPSSKRPSSASPLPSSSRPAKRNRTATASVAVPSSASNLPSAAPKSNRTGFTALFSRSTFIEYFNKNKALKLKDKLEHVVGTGSANQSDTDNLTSLKAILERADGNNFIYTSYHQTYNYKQTDSDFNARFFANGPSAQRYSKKLRATIFGADLYYDLDFVNCQPALLVQYAAEICVPAPILGRIVADRESVLSEIQASDTTINTREDAKEAVIKAMYGSQMVPNVPWWTDFVAEIAAITSAVCASRQDLVDAAIKAKGPSRFTPTVLSFFLGELECSCVTALYTFLVDQGLMQPGLCILMFDGLQLLRNPTNDAVLADPSKTEAFLRSAEDFIEQKTGHRLGLAVKPFAEGYDLPVDMAVEITQVPPTTTATLEDIVGIEQAAGIAQYDPLIKPENLSPPVVINPLYSNTRVIVDKREDDSVGLIPVSQRTIALSAACGMGKTRALVRYVRRLRNWANVIVVHRKSVTEKLRYDLRDCGAAVLLYSEISGVIRVAKGETLVIQVESLRRLDYENFDWSVTNLILDEFNSLERQLRDSSADTHRAWKALLHNSHRVLVMDAYLWNRHILSLSKSRGCTDDVWHLDYVHMKSFIENHNFYINSGKQKGVDMVLQSLQQGQRVVCACINRSLAETVKRLVAEQQPTKKVLLITSHTSEAERKFATSDVNTAWLQFDLVIFTGTVEVGLSFEVADHFHKVVAIVDSSATTAEQVLQMLFRARCVKDFFIYVDRNINIPLAHKTITAQLEEWDSRLERVLQDFDSVLQKEIIDTRDFLGTTLQRTGFCFSMANVAVHDYMSKKSFAALLVLYLQRYGGNIHLEKDTEEAPSADLVATTQATKETLASIKTEEATAIVEAPMVSESEYELLKRTGHSTTDELRKIQKYEFMTDFEIDTEKDSGKVDVEFVEALNNDRIKRKFRNCSRLKKALDQHSGSVDDALESIEHSEISGILNGVAEAEHRISLAPRRGGTGGTDMRDVLGYRFGKSKVGHFRVCEEMLRFMFGENGDMSLAKFDREFTQEEIAANLGGVGTMVTRSRKQKKEFVVTDPEKLGTFHNMVKKLKQNPYFSTMHTKFTLPAHSDQYVYVSDIISLATVVFGAVFGRACVKCTDCEHSGKYVFAQNKAIEMISSVICSE